MSHGNAPRPPLAFATALAASPRRRRTLLHMTIGGTVMLLLVLAALSWLQSSLIARTDPRYQMVTSAILHAVTGNFVTLTTRCAVSGAALTLLSGPWRGTKR